VPRLNKRAHTRTAREEVGRRKRGRSEREKEGERSRLPRIVVNHSEKELIENGKRREEGSTELGE
jgi:hypothetical protein